MAIKKMQILEWYSVKRQRQWMQTEKHDMTFKHEKKCLYCEAKQILEQLAQRCYGVSTARDIQNLTGHSSEQHAGSDPDLIRGIGLHSLEGCLLTSVAPLKQVNLEA